MLIAALYNLDIYLEPLNEYTDYLLVEIWIRPSITYGLVACFVSETAASGMQDLKTTETTRDNNPRRRRKKSTRSTKSREAQRAGELKIKRQERTRKDK